ncbi:MAG: glycoside hydrolase family 2 TIM barrel-domain containing protein, partial [Anaerolineales bacterium]
PAPNPKLWDVGAPNLYTAQVALCRGASRAPTDALADTFGFRTIETRDGQILLNGRPIYLRGALDQDYYPDLICTPPSLDYIEAQFRQAQALGLNCLRVHIKVADPRYYAAADRAGLLIWTEVPNWSRLTADSMRRGRETLEGMIRRDWNHPSIILWTIVNEAWGTELAINPDHCSWLGEMYDWVKSLDPTRLVVDNSACAPDFHVRSDLDDYHFYASIPEGAHLWDKWIREFANRAEWIYNAPPSQGGEQGRGHAPLLVSEFGNWGLPDTGPLFEHYGGEPWWFETGWDWGTAEVYAHGVEERFRALCLDRVFGDFAGLARAAQWAEYEALKYEIETIRLYPSIAGYVVTEFTDVHWECNGLLDMLRNPKVFCSELADLNGDTLIIPHAARAAQWAGEAVDVELSLSHVGPQPIRGARLQWTLAGEPEFGIAGQVVDISIDPFTSLPLEPPHFRLPSVATPRMARLPLTLNAQNDRIIARNHLDLSIFPRPPAPQAPLFCPDESLAPRLASLGYSLTSNPSSNSIALLTRLDSTARRRLQEGEHVLFLAESPDDLETSIPRLVLKARQGTVWADTSAATFTWYRKDKLGPIIPGDGRLGLACASITPKTVIALFGTREFEHDVLAGIFAGWLRYGAALIFKLPVGRGMLLATTLRLKDQLGVDPVATAVFNALVNELSALL